MDGKRLLQRARKQIKDNYKKIPISSASCDWLLQALNEFLAEFERRLKEGGSEGNKALAARLTEFVAIGDAFEKNAFIQHDFLSKLLNESAAQLKAAESFDILVMSSIRDSSSPYTVSYGDDRHKIAFIFDSSRASVMSSPLLGLLCHETAHVRTDIRRKAFSLNPTEAKAGEVLSDLFALALSGPAFSSAIEHFANNINTRSLDLPSTSHPSFYLRSQIMKQETPILFTGNIISNILGKLSMLDGAYRDDPKDITQIDQSIETYRSDIAAARLDPEVFRRIEAGEETTSALYRLAACSGEMSL